MKKIFLVIIFIVSVFISFSQPVVNRTTGTNTVNDPRLSATLNLFIPRYNDTLSANVALSKGVDSCGGIIFTYDSGYVWVRRCSPVKYWAHIWAGVNISGGGGSGSPNTAVGTKYSLAINGTNLVKSLRDSSYFHLDSLLNGTVRGWIDTAGLFGIYNTSYPIAANNGASLSGRTVQLGQTFNQAGDPSVFTTSREIYTGASLSNLFRIRGPDAASYFLINHNDNDGIFRFSTGQLKETIIHAQGYDYGWVKMRIDNGYDSTGIGINYSSAASGILLSNRLGGFGQLYVGFPANAFINDGFMIAASGVSGLRLTSTSGPIVFTVGQTGGGEYARFTANRMGIGTTTPNQKLSVGGSFSTTDSVIHPNLVRQTDTTGYDVLLVHRTTGNVKRIYSGLAGGATPQVLYYLYPLYAFNDTTLAIDTGAGRSVVRTWVTTAHYVDSLFATGGGGGTLIAAYNGVTDSSGRVILGGSLYKTTTIDANSYSLIISTSVSGVVPLQVSSTDNNAIQGTSVDGKGVVGLSTNSAGIEGGSTTGYGGFFQTAAAIAALNVQGYGADLNSITPMVRLFRVNSNPPAAGIGQSVDFDFYLSNFSTHTMNQFISELTDATEGTRTSKFSITGVNSAVTNTLLTLAGSGAARLNQYGAGTFTGTATYALSVDASGNIIETTAGGGGSAFLPVTGTGTATGSIVGDLSGNVLDIQQGGNELLHIDPTAGSEQSYLLARNATGGSNIASHYSTVSNTNAEAELTAVFNGGAKVAGIDAFADVTSATMTYTADTHNFLGTVLPATNNTYDFGSASFKWKDGYFAGKLTVDGAIDPTYLVLNEQAGNPTNAANKGYLFTKDVSGITQLYYMTDAGTAYQMTPNTGGGLTVGTTAIASGTTTRILYDNAGTLGEYTITGTGTVVAMQTSPSFITSVIGGASFDAFNTVSTTLNIGGAATTMTIGGTPTTAITHNYSTNATATATTKTINFGTGGASGSTTNINIGDADGGTIAILSNTTVTKSTGAALTVTGATGSNTNYAITVTGRIGFAGVTSPFSDLDGGNGTIAAGSITITTAAGTNQTGNFSTGAQGLVGSNVGSIYQVLSSSTVNAHVYEGGTGATAVGVGLPGATTIIGAATLAEAASGTHPIFASLIVKAPTITGAAATLTNQATVYIESQPAGTATNTYSLWVDAGDTRLDGDLTAARLSTTFQIGIGGQLNAGDAAATNTAIRLTNGGSNINAAANFGSMTTNTAGQVSYSIDFSNGFMLNAANGTRHITRAGINITNLVNTAGSESADLIFLTQTAGAAMAERMRISSTGNILVTGQYSSTAQTVTYGTTITWNWNSGTNAVVTLTGNITTFNISNAVAGTYATIRMVQDATGSRLLSALPASSKVVNGGAGAITLSTAANAIDLLTVYYDGTNYYWNYGKDYN